MYLCLCVRALACALCALVLNVYIYVNYEFVLKSVDYNHATTFSFEVLAFLSV